MFVNRKSVAVVKRRVFGRLRHAALVDLRGLPKGTFKLKIAVVATDGRLITGTRTYHTCSKKRRGGRKRPGPL